MKEIVVISGKGGAGKTSVAASFAQLACGKAIIADCDVDAADLYLILDPVIHQESDFRSGREAIIRADDCTGCGRCAELCRFNAIFRNGSDPAAPFEIDHTACEGCGVCVRFCPVHAIDFPEQVCGQWFISHTRFGAMVHAKLGVAAENSGRLVTLVRSEAKKLAEAANAEYILVDGSPGIGCPVIASLTAADLAVIVAEPSVSGVHDLRRIAGLASKLDVPAAVCVNKWDINPEKADEIERFAQTASLIFAGRIRYDSVSTRAQRKKMAITELSGEGVAKDIQRVWRSIQSYGT